MAEWGEEEEERAVTSKSPSHLRYCLVVIISKVEVMTSAHSWHWHQTIIWTDGKQGCERGLECRRSGLGLFASRVGMVGKNGIGEGCNQRVQCDALGGVLLFVLLSKYTLEVWKSVNLFDSSFLQKVLDANPTSLPPGWILRQGQQKRWHN